MGEGKQPGNETTRFAENLSLRLEGLCQCLPCSVGTHAAAVPPDGFLSYLSTANTNTVGPVLIA